MDQHEFREEFGIAMGVHEGEVGGSKLILDHHELVTGTAAILGNFRLEFFEIEVEAFGDGGEMLRFEVLAAEHDGPGGVVIDDDAAVTVEDFAARSGDGELFDAIALGEVAVDFGLLNLKLPEA